MTLIRRILFWFVNLFRSAPEQLIKEEEVPKKLRKPMFTILPNRPAWNRGRDYYRKIQHDRRRFFQFRNCPIRSTVATKLRGVFSNKVSGYMSRREIGDQSWANRAR